MRTFVRIARRRRAFCEGRCEAGSASSRGRRAEDGEEAEAEAEEEEERKRTHPCYSHSDTTLQPRLAVEACRVHWQAARRRRVRVRGEADEDGAAPRGSWGVGRASRTVETVVLSVRAALRGERAWYGRELAPSSSARRRRRRRSSAARRSLPRRPPADAAVHDAHPTALSSLERLLSDSRFLSPRCRLALLLELEAAPSARLARRPALAALWSAIIKLAGHS